MIYPKHEKSFTRRVLLIAAILLSLLAIAADTFAAEYWAPRNSDKYHLPTCKLMEKVKPDNRLIFVSPERARKVGYTPCEICKPPGASKPAITQPIQKKEAVEPQKTEIVQDKQTTKEEWSEKGFARWQVGDYPGAIQEFAKGIEVNPRNEKAFYNRGLSYAMVEKYGEALEDFGKAISLNPRYTLAYTNRGIVYMFQKEYGRADEDFNRAIELDPGYPGIYYNKSCLYSLMNYIEQSCLWLRIAIEHGYNDWGHVKTDSDLANIRDSSCYKALMDGK